MAQVFESITDIHLPKEIACNAQTGRNLPFCVTFRGDGEIPFPQVILWVGCEEHLIRGSAIEQGESGERIVHIPGDLVSPGEYSLQIEGCRRQDIENASAGDWIKEFVQIHVVANSEATPVPHAEPKEEVAPAPIPATPQDPNAVKVYFSIHKHMHQPYYDATDTEYWDGEKDEIFGSRGGPYTDFVPRAVRQYIESGLPHAGLSTSWSGSLIEQLNRCETEGLCGGCFGGWKESLREVAGSQTACGYPRVDFSAFGFFHPLMALVPERDIVRQIQWHRNIIRETFGSDASSILFPPETAFHVRMIPALVKAGVTGVLYDSIHRFRACEDYPYAGSQEGMLPPNPAEQINPAVQDWMQLHNIWAGSLISPSLLRPEYIRYEDPDGETHSIIGIPAERYIGNEDARGGFGALQYPDVLGQVYDQICKTGTFDPAHPPFFVLHSDGDNHGGGAESYYGSNTGELMRWLQSEPRFELTSIRDYLERFPPDPANAVHVEPGSWSGADNGDPQFRKWFSMYEQPYSPDLNSWAVLTALQNALFTLEDINANTPGLQEAQRLLLTAETSCYWYWTGQEVWDRQVTNAANKALGLVEGELHALVQTGNDTTGPTIFSPWVYPENPGGQAWGEHGNLKDAPKDGTVHTFVHDISGLKRVSLVLRTSTGETTLSMNDHGPYPTQTGARAIANYFTAPLPAGAGVVKYYIEAEDNRGNCSRSSLEHIYLQ